MFVGKTVSPISDSNLFNQKVFILKNSGDIVSINVGNFIYYSCTYSLAWESSQQECYRSCYKKSAALLDETISNFFHYLKT